MFDLRPKGWHLVGLLLHGLNAVLLFLLLLGWTGGRTWVAGASALLVALHPVAVESVTWISSQGDLLAVTLGLGVLLLYRRPGGARTVVGWLAFGLALLAKESALAWPALVVLAAGFRDAEGRRPLWGPHDARPGRGAWAC